MRNLFLFIVAILLSTTVLAADQQVTKQVPKSAITLHETYSITLENYTVKLGKKKNRLTIVASWQYQPNIKPNDYVDSNEMVKSIKNFFQGYPNKDAYWELINHDLTTTIIDHYSQLQKVTLTLIIPPTKTDPYAKISKDTAERKM